MKKMTLLSAFITLVPFFISACSISKADESSEPILEKPKISILEHSGLVHLQSTLSKIIQERTPQAKPSQHFYIADYKPNATVTYMLWKEGRMLWIMSLGGDDEESWLGMRYPTGGQLIDLDKDVVATKKEVGSSTYLVSRAWVNQRVYDAVVDGSLITIER